MRILAFDTTNSTLSVAILEDQKILAKSTIFENGKQSEMLIPEIEKILTEAKIWYQDLDYLAATQGPGSFTGVRIGLSSARTLKLATNLPLILLDSLEVLAFKYRHKFGQNSGKIFAAIDARMDEFFIGNFLSNAGEISKISESQLVSFSDVINFLPKEKFFLCGSGKKILAEILENKNFEFEYNEEEDVIEADLVGLLAKIKISGEILENNSEALYLREPRISKRKEENNGGRGRNRTDA